MRRRGSIAAKGIQQVPDAIAGGKREPTPFQYVVESLVRGATRVSGYPWPRTKGSYTIDEQCEKRLKEAGLRPSGSRNTFAVGHEHRTSNSTLCLHWRFASSYPLD